MRKLIITPPRSLKHLTYNFINRRLQIIYAAAEKYNFINRRLQIIYAAADNLKYKKKKAQKYIRASPRRKKHNLFEERRIDANEIYVFFRLGEALIYFWAFFLRH
uniref:hypothetical protein n=1 Tax=Cephaleuros parasiticus TaxID=173370 RepID=UPI001EE042BD|nr:hypothetical protein MFQ79_pgp035 [Cephaleuros parasiticus]UIB39027.1 hypothetical protein [Cephaleuros parasiticus]